MKSAIRCSLAVAVLCLGGRAFADDPVTPKNLQPVAENKKDEPLAKQFSMEKAAHFIDSAALYWHEKNKCFSCHSNFSYMYSRPTLSAEAPAHAVVRKQLEDLVGKRWQTDKPRWDAEVVTCAAALAHNDANTAGKLHPLTRTALDRMWTVQRKDGGFNWLICGWPPMENDDHYGVTLAALAVGVAPEGYAKTEQARKGMEGLRAYLKSNPPQNLHHKAMMLWAGSHGETLLSTDEKAAAIKELRAVQRPDGGWSAAGLGKWKRSDKLEQDPDTSDGYGTGFVVFVLRRAGVPANDPALQKGVAWLKANQRESGRWFTRSLNRDNKHYLTHAGTNFAVMALAACEDKGAKVGAR